MSAKVHLLRAGRTTACGLRVGRGINYVERLFPWEGYGDVDCETCKNFIRKLNKEAKGYRR